MGRIIITNIYLGLFCVLAMGCQKEYLEPQLTGQAAQTEWLRKKRTTPCPEYSYLYNNAPANLGTVNTTKIIIGFDPAITLSEKEAFIAQYVFLAGIENSYNTGSADATIVLLQDGLTCTEVEAALVLLAKAEVVRYANPAFKSPVGDNLLGITNQFILTLKPGYTREDLQKLTRRTKTEIVEALGEDIFILSADKYATGNALQLANEFAAFKPILTSEPDFLFLF